MIIVRGKRFTKSFKKRIENNLSLLSQFKKRWQLFANDSSNPLLKDHSLKGSLLGFRSFSITGNVRLIYKKEGETVNLFDIGSHNQVYK